MLIPESDPDLMYIGLNDRDPAWHDLYALRISTGELTLLRENTDRFTSWIFDNNDELRLATRSASNGDTEVLRVDEDGFTQIYTCDVHSKLACLPVSTKTTSASTCRATKELIKTSLRSF
jgi:hypothetical protein